MLMHMPTKWGAVVIVAVAACVGAFYVLVVRPERVDGWEVYQGSGRMVRSGEGLAVDWLDVSYRVTNPAKPLFSYRHLGAGAAGDGVSTLGLTYRTERDTTIVVVVTDNGGAAFQAKWKLQHSDVWRGEVLGAEEFEPRTAPGRAGGQAPDFGRMVGRRVDFYDGSGVVRPSTTFSNRLELLPPELLGQGK